MENGRMVSTDANAADASRILSHASIGPASIEGRLDPGGVDRVILECWKLQRQRMSVTMPAHDVFHAAVKEGLIKEGWTITDDPLIIEFGGQRPVHRPGCGEGSSPPRRGSERIAVEVKSFLGPSLVTRFSHGPGAILELPACLGRQGSRSRPLPGGAGTDLFRVLYAPARHKTRSSVMRVHLIVYDPESEALVQWIK